ncbi:MAG: DUF4166 domain-containing protein [Hyphomicrobiaceae bacterium]|nr:DUF4166 domain-containing protein [Hyphomicrobiaceae bacterium]
MNALTATDTITLKPPRSGGLHNDFRSVVEGRWQDVYPDVRARMDRLLTSPADTVFEGTGCVRRSRTGWVFAQLSRLFGGPLVRAQGEQVKVRVRVAPTANGLRCWHREFIFADGTRQMVQTTKIVDPKLGMLDAVGTEGEKLLAMKMRVWSQGKSLFFESDAYILRFRFLAIRIPAILTPGRLFAEHRDEGNGVFRYILAFRHPLWGETFYQDGLFRQVG